jgi:Arylsulfotransferase (ASST)/Carbohydrate binding domain
MPRLLTLLGLALLFQVDCARCQSPARQAGYLYLSPVPGASYVSPQTRYILLRFVNTSPGAVTNLTQDFITVSGQTSGIHSGSTRIASDGRTVIFEMHSDFTINELVTVSLLPALSGGGAGTTQPFSYQFMVTAPMPGSLPLGVAGSGLPDQTQSVAKNQPLEPRVLATQGPDVPGRKAKVMPNGVSVPSDFPASVITGNNNPSPGYLFLENALGGVPPYTMILDNNGSPIWYRQGRMFDFKIQTNGMITWCQYDASGLAIYSAFDQNFNFVRTYGTTNGYLTDGHDLKVLADGSYYIIASRTNAVDMRLYIANAPTLAIVTETVVQGFTALNELIFQWRSWDNYDIRDLVPIANSDFAHMNGIDIDDDGNLLVSARHLSEVTKVNTDSGDIMWRLSGVHSSFNFLHDPLNGTSYQHNISALGNGRYMVFDNGDYHSPIVSRAVEYQLDLTNMTADMIWQFRDTPDKYTFWLGSAQRLASGNTLIDFVSSGYPKAIEVDSNGIKHFELSLVPGSESYRAFRFPWNGAAAAPYLVLESQPDNVTLIFNKFGDTNVAFYRIYGGPAPQPTTVLAQSATPLKQLSNLPNGLFYFRVTAVSRAGVESPFSNEQSLKINIVQPGQDLVKNGDFSQGGLAWNFTQSGTANATWAVEEDTSRFFITNGGTTLGSVQLFQSNLPLTMGQQYVLQFDAWADQPRYIQAQVAQSVTPFADYSKLTPSFLTPNRTHYRYLFTMEQPSDPAASLVFNLGSVTGTVYLTNISLFRPLLGDLNLDGRVDSLDLGILSGNWLKQQAGLPGDLDESGKVDFNDLNLLGQHWASGTP